MNATSACEVELLSPEQIEERLAHRSVVFLPLGSIEFHGPHLPVGLDALTARGVCIAAAERVGGVVLPAVHFGVGGEHTRYPWTLMVEDGAAVGALLSGTLERLDQLGVERVVLVSGHFAGEQQDLIAEVAARWNGRRSSGMEAVARTLGQVPDPPVDPDHAGRFESLLLGALEPGLVRPWLLPDVEAHPDPDPDHPFSRDRHREDHPLHGVFGPDPRRLPTELGQPLLEHLVAWVCGLAVDQDERELAVPDEPVHDELPR